MIGRRARSGITSADISFPSRSQVTFTGLPMDRVTSSSSCHQWSMVASPTAVIVSPGRSPAAQAGPPSLTVPMYAGGSSESIMKLMK